MHPKVLFLDETQLPAGTPTQHPADVFVRRQLTLMRKGYSEEEAYRRVLHLQQSKQRIDDDVVAAARAQASAIGAEAATAAEDVGTAGTAGSGDSAAREGFAARLLRRFAEEARDGGQPYPKHWFLDKDGVPGKGPWRGIGAAQVDKRTVRALERTAQDQSAAGLSGLFSGMDLRGRREAQADAMAGQAEAEAAERAAAAAEAEMESDEVDARFGMIEADDEEPTAALPSGSTEEESKSK